MEGLTSHLPQDNRGWRLTFGISNVLPETRLISAFNEVIPHLSHIFSVHGIFFVMADPFEVRMRFTSQLLHLNASTNSAQKAAHYALKYRDMHEDLHSCILEQLERVRV